MPKRIVTMDGGDFSTDADLAWDATEGHLNVGPAGTLSDGASSLNIWTPDSGVAEYLHAVRLMAKATSAELLHGYNSIGDHVIKINTVSDDSIWLTLLNAGESIHSVFAGSATDPYTVLGGAAGQRIGSADVTVRESLAVGGLAGGGSRLLTTDNSGNVDAIAVDDTPMDGATTVPVSSNWAADHLTTYDHTQIGAGGDGASLSVDGYTALEDLSPADIVVIEEGTTNVEKVKERAPVYAYEDIATEQFYFADSSWDEPNPCMVHLDGDRYLLAYYHANLDVTMCRMAYLTRTGVTYGPEFQTALSDGDRGLSACLLREDAVLVVAHDAGNSTGIVVRISSGDDIITGNQFAFNTHSSNVDWVAIEQIGINKVLMSQHGRYRDWQVCTLEVLSDDNSITQSAWQTVATITDTFYAQFPSYIKKMSQGVYLLQGIKDEKNITCAGVRVEGDGSLTIGATASIGNNNNANGSALARYSDDTCIMAWVDALEDIYVRMVSVDLDTLAITMHSPTASGLAAGENEILLEVLDSEHALVGTARRDAAYTDIFRVIDITGGTTVSWSETQYDPAWTERDPAFDFDMHYGFAATAYLGQGVIAYASQHGYMELRRADYTGISSTNLTEALGVVDVGGLSGAIVSVFPLGSVADVFTGLIPGARYYIHEDGTFDQFGAAGAHLVGVAISTTHLQTVPHATIIEPLHVQGTDKTLAKGSTEEVSAAELRAHVDGGEASAHVPDASSATDGDVLTVQADGSAAWEAAATGGGGASVDGYTALEDLSPADIVVIEEGTTNVEKVKERAPVYTFSEIADERFSDIITALDGSDPHLVYLDGDRYVLLYVTDYDDYEIAARMAYITRSGASLGPEFLTGVTGITDRSLTACQIAEDRVLFLREENNNTSTGKILTITNSDVITASPAFNVTCPQDAYDLGSTQVSANKVLLSNYDGYGAWIVAVLTLSNDGQNNSLGPWTTLQDMDDYAGPSPQFARMDDGVFLGVGNGRDRELAAVALRVNGDDTITAGAVTYLTSYMQVEAAMAQIDGSSIFTVWEKHGDLHARVVTYNPDTLAITAHTESEVVGSVSRDRIGAVAVDAEHVAVLTYDTDGNDDDIIRVADIVAGVNVEWNQAASTLSRYTASTGISWNHVPMVYLGQGIVATALEGHVKVVRPAYTGITSTNIKETLGVVAEGGLTGETVSLYPMGVVADGFVGLEPGRRYYVHEDGVVDQYNTADAYLLGVAISTTQMHTAPHATIIEPLHVQGTDKTLAKGSAEEVSAAELRAHVDAVDNPHGVTLTQLGLTCPRWDNASSGEDCLQVTNWTDTQRHLQTVNALNPEKNISSRKTVDHSAFGGGWEFIGGVLLSDGRVFFVPHHDTTALIYDPVTGEVTVPTGSYPASSAFFGGVLLPDGRVFCIPHNSTSARIYDPVAETTTTPTGVYPGSTAFIGGVLLPDGRVFCAPRGATQSLIYDPVADTLVAGGGTYPGGSHLFGAVLLPDGRVFLVPSDGTTARIYDPVADTVTTPTGTYPGTDAFRGGVLLPDGRVFMVPSSSTTARIYDPVSDTLTTPSGTYPGTTAFAFGTLLPDGRVFLAPFKSTSAYIYDPVADEAVALPSLYSGDNSFVGAVALLDGRVLCIPTKATEASIYGIRTNSPYSASLLTGPFYNNL